MLGWIYLYLCGWDAWWGKLWAAISLPSLEQSNPPWSQQRYTNRMAFSCRTWPDRGSAVPAVAISCNELLSSNRAGSALWRWGPLNSSNNSCVVTFCLKLTGCLISSCCTGSCECVCYPPSNMESVGGRGWKCLCSRACPDTHPVHKGLDGLHCYVLQHPCRWLAGGQPGPVHTLPPGGAGLELPLQPAAGGNTEMVTRCESNVLFVWFSETSYILYLHCPLMSHLFPVCRFCVSKRFRRTTTMNSCVQSCLRWVGHLR